MKYLTAADSTVFYNFPKKLEKQRIFFGTPCVIHIRIFKMDQTGRLA